MNEQMDLEQVDDVEEIIPGETKAAKFIRLADKRTQNAIKQITGIGKLSSSAYEYTPDQVEKIFGALQKALDKARSNFEKQAEEEEFHL